MTDDFYQSLYDRAVASGYPPDHRVVILVFWEPGEDMFDPEYTPPMEHFVTIQELQGKFTPPASSLLEYITTTTLNVRPEPSTRRSRIDVLSKGAKIRAKPVPSNAAWVEVVEPTKGYVSLAYLRPV